MAKIFLALRLTYRRLAAYLAKVVTGYCGSNNYFRGRGLLDFVKRVFGQANLFYCYRFENWRWIQILGITLEQNKEV